MPDIATDYASKVELLCAILFRQYNTVEQRQRIKPFTPGGYINILVELCFIHGQPPRIQEWLPAISKTRNSIECELRYDYALYLESVLSAPIYESRPAEVSTDVQTPAKAKAKAARWPDSPAIRVTPVKGEFNNASVQKIFQQIQSLAELPDAPTEALNALAENLDKSFFRGFYDNIMKQLEHFQNYSQDVNSSVWVIVNEDHVMHDVGGSEPSSPLAPKLAPKLEFRMRKIKPDVDCAFSFTEGKSLAVKTNLTYSFANYKKKKPTELEEGYVYYTPSVGYGEQYPLHIVDAQQDHNLDVAIMQDDLLDDYWRTQVLDTVERSLWQLSAKDFVQQATWKNDSDWKLFSLYVAIGASEEGKEPVNGHAMGLLLEKTETANYAYIFDRNGPNLYMPERILYLVQCLVSVLHLLTQDDNYDPSRFGLETRVTLPVTDTSPAAAALSGVWSQSTAGSADEGGGAAAAATDMPPHKRARPTSTKDQLTAMLRATLKF